MTERTFLDGDLDKLIDAAEQHQASKSMTFPRSRKECFGEMWEARQRIIDAVRDYGRRCMETAWSHEDCDVCAQLAQALMAETENDP